MTTAATFERDLRLATAGMEPAAIAGALAAFAKAELAKAIAEGASPRYERFVNGVEGAAEESVVPPGPILYRFVNWPQIIEMALAELVRRGPRPSSGRFNRSYVVIAGGRVVVTDWTKIRADAEIIITNFQPYVRKAEVGRLGIPERRLFAGTARVLRSRFGGSFSVVSKFVDIPPGIVAGAPYRLKGGGNRGRSHDRISRRSGVLSYPALIINRGE